MHFSDLFNYDGDAGYIIEEGSDDEWNGASSDEDNEELFNNFLSSREERNTNDDFLTEMKKELDETVAKVQSQNKVKTEEKGESSTNKTTETEFYDEIYFDSDDSDENETENEKPKEKKKKKHPIPTNDDLFYDPDMDEADQKWIDDYRRSCQPKTTSKIQPLPNSDAVLNCPACMTLLCLDCQRHDVYTNQYRAMFVQNCSVNTDQILNYPLKTKKKKNVESKTEKYHPVKCSICNTEVAVYDQNEIYHFFNVITSYA